MILKRLFPTRWARIAAWTGAAITWAVTILATQTITPPSTAAGTLDIAEPEDPTPAASQVSQPIEVIPTPPEDGLLVIRFTPAPPPPPRVITQTVVVGGGGGGGGPAPAFNPSSISKVQSAGS